MADTVDPAVGFVITVKPGDQVQSGEPMASIYARNKDGILAGRAALEVAITVADEAEPPLKLVSHRISRDGVEAF